MTDFEHAEISRRLALAIGWAEHQLEVEAVNTHAVLWVCVAPATIRSYATHCIFDYRDPLIAWSVAERFNCFPAMVSSGTQWYAYTAGAKTTWAETAVLAVAMAVIKAKEGK